jgi:hypothetical protein
MLSSVVALNSAAAVVFCSLMVLSVESGGCACSGRFGSVMLCAPVDASLRHVRCFRERRCRSELGPACTCAFGPAGIRDLQSATCPCSRRICRRISSTTCAYAHILEAMVNEQEGNVDDRQLRDRPSPGDEQRWLELLDALDLDELTERFMSRVVTVSGYDPAPIPVSELRRTGRLSFSTPDRRDCGPAASMDRWRSRRRSASREPGRAFPWRR